MHPVIVMFIGTCADMRPIRIIFSPVSGWKAESKIYLAFQSSSSVSPGETTPCLRESKSNSQANSRDLNVKSVTGELLLVYL